jgi:hypothetical protein
VDDSPVVLAVDHPVTVPLPPKFPLITLDVKSFTGYVYTMVLPANHSHDVVSATIQGLQKDTLVFNAISPAPSY